MGSGWRLTSPLWLYEEERQVWSGRNGMRSRGWSAKRISVYKSSDYKSKKIKLRRVLGLALPLPVFPSPFSLLSFILYATMTFACLVHCLPGLYEGSRVFKRCALKRWSFEGRRRSTFLPPSAVSAAAAAGHQSQMWPTTDSDTIIRSGRSRSFNHWQITRITVNPMPLGG